MTNKVLSVRVIFERWLNLLMLTIEQHGEIIEREVIEHPNGAIVLPYDRQRRVAMMVKQPRPPVLYLGAEPMLEAVAGAVDCGDPLACARREAMEEVGLELTDLELVAHVWATPASSTEQCHCYLAPYTERDRVGQGGGIAEEQEQLEVHEIPLSVLGAMLDANAPLDTKTLILVQALKLREPELFKI